jgi:hypothetical protein
MSSSPERPADTEVPLNYALRWAQDEQQKHPRDPTGAMPTTGIASRGDKQPGADTIPPRPFPLGDMRSPLVTPVPPPPSPLATRGRFSILGQIALLALFAIVSAVLVVAFYSWNSPRTADTARAIPATPRVAVDQPRAPVTIVERGNPSPSTALTAAEPRPAPAAVAPPALPSGA